MNFKSKGELSENVGVFFGFAFMFIVFSVILYFVLKLTDRLPSTWSYFDTFLIAFSLVIIGKFLKEVLK